MNEEKNVSVVKFGRKRYLGKKTYIGSWQDTDLVERYRKHAKENNINFSATVELLLKTILGEIKNENINED